MALKSNKYGFIVGISDNEFSKTLSELSEISDNTEDSNNILKKILKLDTREYKNSRRRKNYIKKAQKTKEYKPEKQDKATPVKKTKWYKSVLNQLKKGDKDSFKWNKKQDKKLEDIKNKSTKSGGGLLQGIALLSLLLKGAGARVAGSFLSRFVMAGMAMKGASKVAGWAFAKNNKNNKNTTINKKDGFLKRGLKNAKNIPLLRRVPILGALLAGGTVGASELFSKKSRKEKNKVIGSEVGRAGGAIAGMATGATIGTMILPVIGTAIGGAIGAWFGSDAGSILGEKASEFFDTDIWSSIKKYHKKAVDIMSGVFEGADKVASKAKEGHSWAVDKTSNGIEWVANLRKSLINKTSDAMTWGAQKKRQVSLKTSDLIDSVTGKVTGRGGASTKSVKRVLEQIAIGEGTAGTAGYDTTFSYGKWDKKGRKKLTEMTLGEVKAHQAEMINNQRRAGKGRDERSSATGKYQFISKTLRNTQNEMGVRDDEIFTPELQDRMGEHLARKYGGLNKYLKSSRTKSDMYNLQSGLSSQWSSVSNPGTGVSSHTFGGKTQRSVNSLGNMRKLYSDLGTGVKSVVPRVNTEIKPLVMPTYEKETKKITKNANTAKKDSIVRIENDTRDVPDRKIAHIVSGGIS